MLSITGTYKGQSVEDKVVSARELIEHFKLPISPKTEKVTFELDKKAKGVIAINAADGRERFAERNTISPLASGTYEGETCQIRYYTSKQKNKDGVKYTPARVEYTGKRHSVNTRQDLELAVFLMLYPKCADSPIRSRRSPVRYKMYSAEAISKQKIQAEEQYAKLREAILKSDDDYAVRMAKAISHKLRLIPMSETDGPSIAKAALLDLIRTKPDAVRQAMSTPQMEVIGAVMHAQSTGRIEMNPNTAGRTAWYYKETGEEIVSVPKGKPVLDHLFKHLSDAEEFSDFVEKIYGAKPTVKSVDPTLSEDAQVIKSAIDSGVLQKHPTEPKVYIMVGNQFQDRALKVLDDPDNWKEEMVQSATSTMAARVQKYM